MRRFKYILRKIEWPNFLFIVLSPVIAIAGTIWVIGQGGPHTATWVLTGVMLGLTGIGITMGYHRLFSHRSYQAHWSVRLLCLLFGGASFQGSAREWSCAHRKHHQFVDTPGDPYNIKQGFWHAHVLWVVLKADQSDESNIEDLKRDPLVLFQDRFYTPLAVLVSFVLPTAIAAVWGDPWGGLFVAGWLRVVINHHLTFLINSYAHFFGRQTYSDRDSARDNWFLAFFTYGEGFHNFHHSFASDYRNGIRAFHWDPSKWIIHLLARMGLTSRLKRTSPAVILRAKLAMDEKRLHAKLARQQALHHDWTLAVSKAKQNLEQVYTRWIELKTSYYELRRQKSDLVIEKLHALRRDMNQAKAEFNQAMGYWSMLMSGRLQVVS